VGDKDIILVGILEQKLDAYQRAYWSPQIEGSKTALELPGIVDEVISLVVDPREPEGEKSNEDSSHTSLHDLKPKTRVFVCITLNPWGYPAKDRSGRLQELEEPDLGKLLAKIKQGRVRAQQPRGDLELFSTPDENLPLKAPQSHGEPCLPHEHKESLDTPLQSSFTPDAHFELNAADSPQGSALSPHEAAGSSPAREELSLNQPIVDEKENLNEL
jgi:hypothetical protein